MRRFVSDSVPPALVDRVAATFTRSDGDIREVCARSSRRPSSSRARVQGEGEVAVRARGERAARRRRAAGQHAAHRAADREARAAAVRAPRAERLSGARGRVDQHRRDPRAHQLRTRRRGGPRARCVAGRVDGWDRRSPRCRTTQQVDGVIRAILGGEASPDTRKVLESGVNPMAGDSTATRRDVAGSRRWSGSRSAHPNFSGGSTCSDVSFSSRARWRS